MSRNEGQQRHLPPALSLVLELLPAVAASLFTRIAIALVIAVVASIAAIEAGWSIVAPMASQQAAVQIAAELNNTGLPTSFGVLKLLHQYDLSWLYITQNGRLVEHTTAFAPYMRIYPLISGEVTVKGQKYFEAVAPVTINEAPASVHAAVNLEINPGANLFSALFTSGLFARVPGVYFFILLAQLLLSVILFPLLYIGISLPLQSLERFLQEARSAAAPCSEADYAETGSPLELSEVSHLKQALVETLQDAGMLESQWTSKEEAQRWKGKKARITEEMMAPPLPQLARSGSSTGRFGAADVILNGMHEELAAATTLKQFSRKLLDGLAEAFPEAMKKSALIRKGSDNKYIVLSAHGLSNKTVSVIERIDHAGATAAIPAGSGLTSDIGSMLMKRLGLEPIAEEESVHRIVYFMLVCDKEVRAVLMALIERPDTLTSEQAGNLESYLNQKLAPLYNRLLLTEEAEEAQRTDQLTGLKNKKFLQEALAIEVERARRDLLHGSFTLFMVGGDKFDVIESKHGREVRDKLLQELAASLRSSFRTTRSGQDAPAFWLSRFEDEEFAVIAGSCDMDQAPRMALRLRDACAGKKDSVAGVPLTASVGYSVCPAHGETSEALIAGARKALYYAWDQMPASSIVASNQVPGDFVPSKQGSAIAGELGVLDSPALLQSIAASEKTGLLTVEDLAGRVFTMSFANGVPLKAQLDKLTGVAAVIEYILSYSTGRFAFKQTLDTDNGDQLPGALLPGLEHCLMEAALAEDNWTAAKKTLPHLDYWVRVTPGIEIGNQLQKIRSSNEGLTEEELARIEEVLTTAAGARTIKDLFGMLPDAPTHLKWRWCSILLKSGSIQTKAID